MAFFLTEVPAGVVTDNEIQANSNIDGDKFTQRFVAVYNQATGSDVTTETRIVYTGRKAGILTAVTVFPSTAPTGGGDKKFTVDVQKSTGAGAFATVLSSVVTVDDSSVDRTSQSATINPAAYLAGDTYEVIITASGSTGTQGKDVCVTLHFIENTS